MKKHKGVQSINKVIINRKIKFEISLKPNYSFKSTGTQIQYVDKEDIDEMMSEIVYCDGNCVI